MRELCFPSVLNCPPHLGKEMTSEKFASIYVEYAQFRRDLDAYAREHKDMDAVREAAPILFATKYLTDHIKVEIAALGSRSQG